MIIKDFQEASAERIAEIFCNEGQRRVLLSDEVGLGKTIVARQVIKKLYEQQVKNGGNKSFQVIYVCSNINISKQNCVKLGMDDKSFNLSEHRLSMLHLKMYQNREKKLAKQLIPMTPATSFVMSGRQGTMEERALIFVFLSKLEVFAKEKKNLSDFLSCNVRKDTWKNSIERYKRDVTVCDKIVHCYCSDMLSEIKKTLSPDLISRLKNSCSAPGAYDKTRTQIIAELRRLFAEISLKNLTPDLIIMDEFQKFKDLMVSDGKDETSVIIEKFFFDKTVRILLLSATPYKAYSTQEELLNKNEDHYKEFMDLMNFLLLEESKIKKFKQVWTSYSSALAKFFESGIENAAQYDALRKKKAEAESFLYSCICRTERMSSDSISDDKAVPLEPQIQDITSFTDMQLLLNKLNLGKIPIEYIKSAPYLLSFMEYKIKSDIIARMKEAGNIFDVDKSETLLLDRNSIDTYKKISFNNARLQMLVNEAFGKGENGAEFLLWLPPSVPYYKVNNIFSRNAGYSKILVFSSWEMVPRMVAGMLSYEAERIKIEKGGSFWADRHYYADDNQKRTLSKRLRSDEKSKTQEIITYPSKTLAEIYNPIDYFGVSLSVIRRKLSSLIKDRIKNTLTLEKELKNKNTSKKTGRKTPKKTVTSASILDLLKAMDCGGVYDPSMLQPEVIEFLVNMAIGSPAVCALRLFKDNKVAEELAKSFVSLFNKEESMLILDILYKEKQKTKDDFYYQNVIRYCVDGNLQAVLDEFAFVNDALGDSYADTIKNAFIDTAHIQIETKEFFPKTVKDEEYKKSYLRTHFASGYFSVNSEGGVCSTERLRAAFNSPFRPFVLATTSIGQEGLDFHLYCRKLVHWNLPYNPVELEQREGRINRYLCLAIRQNLAESECGKGPFLKNIWNEIIDSAASLKVKDTDEENPLDASDLVPYWVLPKKLACTRKIERIVPMYPYSSDCSRYDRILNVLFLYRLTLGQPCQQDIIKSLSKAPIKNSLDIREFIMNLCPFIEKNKKFHAKSNDNAQLSTDRSQGKKNKMRKGKKRKNSRKTVKNYH